MSSTNTKTAEVRAIDPVWDAITSGAKQVVQAEPSLANLVYSNVLNHPSFEHALAHRLAERLDHSDVSADLIRQAFHDALAMRPEIGLEARADLAATLERDPALHKAVDCFLYFKGFHALQTHRLAHWLWGKGRRDFAYYLQSRSSAAFQCDIHPNARIGRGSGLSGAGERGHREERE